MASLIFIFALIVCYCSHIIENCGKLVILDKLITKLMCDTKRH